MHATHKQRFAWLAALTATVACLLNGAAQADVSQQDEPEQRQVEVIVSTAIDDDSDTEAGKALQFAIEVDAVKPGKYWIGVVCSPLDNDLLKSHLGIEQGLIVKDVVEGSPAQKAGLQDHDILLQVGDTPLADLKALVTTIEAAEGGQLELTFLRKGKKEQVQFQPVNRPMKVTIQQAHPDKETDLEWRQLQEALRRHGAVPQPDAGAAAHSDRAKFMLVMPGFVMPDQVEGLPKNLEVTISKKGKEEAKITVKQGEEQWDVDAKSLDKLPEAIRPHIEKMLGGGHKMSIRMGTDKIDWLKSVPDELFGPDGISKMLKIAPDQVVELHQLAPQLNKEMRERIHNQLAEAHITLEAAKSKLPTNALDKIEAELRELRKQLEELRKARQDADADHSEGADDDNADTHEEGHEDHTDK